MPQYLGKSFELTEVSFVGIVWKRCTSNDAFSKAENTRETCSQLDCEIVVHRSNPQSSRPWEHRPFALSSGGVCRCSSDTIS